MMYSGNQKKQIWWNNPCCSELLYIFFPVTFRNQNYYSINKDVKGHNNWIIPQHFPLPMPSVLHMFNKRSAVRNYSLESKFGYFDDGEFAKFTFHKLSHIYKTLYDSTCELIQHKSPIFHICEYDPLSRVAKSFYFVMIWITCIKPIGWNWIFWGTDAIAPVGQGFTINWSFDCWKSDQPVSFHLWLYSA